MVNALRTSASPALHAPDGELLFENEHTRIWRKHCPWGNRSVICKESLGANGAERTQHERHTLERLAGLDGVPALASAAVPANMLVLEDRQCIPLTWAFRNELPSIPVLVQLALDLADIVAAIHGRGILHKDINPSNILLAGAQRKPMLGDFNLATGFGEERPAYLRQPEIPRTLDYLAPEQSGRTCRTVDQHADLYAFGVTLYELATGRLPFESADPLQLLHDHLTREPLPPAALAPAVPQALSDIIMRLLEKEPDRRYQSASGLACDLMRLQERLARDDTTPFLLGERDFPLRLSAPSRLIGRQEEIGMLRAAFEETLQGKVCGVLVGGPSGTGKTTLINELRPLVAARQGWCVSGKYEQDSKGMVYGALVQSLRMLGCLLLAGTEQALAAHRARILHTVGPNAGLIAAGLPEFATLLGVEPDMSGTNDSARARVAGLDLLRAVASPAQPLVMLIDDLQWADSLALHFIDAILTDDRLQGLLLVCTYRDTDVGAAHPLSALVSRWQRLGVAPRRLQLQNLSRAGMAEMLAEMLRLPEESASRLADLIRPCTRGNPFDTVELLNALRRDGVLLLHGAGWEWDAAAIRRYIAQAEVMNLVGVRIASLPVEAQDLLQVMACLGSSARFALLQAASGLSAGQLEERLRMPLEDGLLSVRAGTGDRLVEFRHDRVQKAVTDGVDLSILRLLHLAVGRRLKRHPEYAVEAALQFLPAIDIVDRPAERREIAALLRRAAAEMRLTSNYRMAEQFLAAALTLFVPLADAGDAQVLAALQSEMHAALYNLGRLDEADEVYRRIESSNPDAAMLAGPVSVQICSLTNRGRPQEAVALGLDLLRRLGFAVPVDMEAEAARRMPELYAWAEARALSDDLARPQASAPWVAAASVINCMIAPAFFSRQRAAMAWLLIECSRLWAEHGPCPAMIGTLSHASFVTVGQQQDYRTGYDVVRHVLAVSEARGYTLEAALARFLFALSACHWREAADGQFHLVQQAREGLLRGGDMQQACFTYYTSIFAAFNEPTLDSTLAEAEAGMALAARTGNEHGRQAFIAYRQLARTLRGETAAPGSFADASFNEQAHLAGLSSNPTALAVFHVVRAFAAAIFGDVQTLTLHAASAMPLLPSIAATYSTAYAHLLQCLALAARIKAAAPETRAVLFAELEICRDWLARRAADAPVNFSHWLSLVDAEQAWATGDHWHAAAAFDAALSRVHASPSPWQRAFITERAGIFHLEQGHDHAGCRLLTDAHRVYLDWGAAAKAGEMERAHVFLHAANRPPHDENRRRTSGISADAIDLRAILRASQALSSETSLASLQKSVVELLRTITGATGVSLALWHKDAQEWQLHHSNVNDAVESISVEDAGARGLLPLSAFRYVVRSQKPLLVGDAVRDDRFARDPYFSGRKRCSLLAAPIFNQNVPHAVLLLENSLSRDAFSTNRLDAVMLIAGQLAVSIDNALLYASLERKVTERTRELEEANRRLAALSITDPLTGLANRRRFAEVLDAEWLRAQRPQSPLGAVMIDIDHFKQYNDRYGHLAGDACLRQVAAALTQCIRTGTDLVARYGGEEFALILPGADYDTAYIVAERVCAAVAALNLPHGDTGQAIVTVSIGIAAVVPDQHGRPAQLFELADAALYDAKRSGRNRVMGRRAE